MAASQHAAPDVPELAYRVASVDDASQIAAWNRELIADEGDVAAVSPISPLSPMSLRELESRMRQWLEAEYRALVFEVRLTPDSAPEAVAYALFRDTAEWIHLRQFFVMRDRRRRGFGARAVQLLRDAVFEPGKLVIVEATTWNRPALAFWRDVGFVDRYVGLESRSAASPRPAGHA